MAVANWLISKVAESPHNYSYPIQTTVSSFAEGLATADKKDLKYIPDPYPYFISHTQTTWPTHSDKYVNISDFHGAAELFFFGNSKIRFDKIVETANVGLEWVVIQQMDLPRGLFLLRSAPHKHWNILFTTSRLHKHSAQTQTQAQTQIQTQTQTQRPINIETYFSQPAN